MDNIEIEEPPGNSDPEPPSKPSQWNNWKWQFANRITSTKDIPGTSSAAAEIFPVAITPYYFSLIEKFDNSDPVFRMCMPQKEELLQIMHNDPLCEDSMMPVNNLVHRYQDRALLISTSTCSMNCRYCTRKRTVGVKDFVISRENLSEITEYLRNHPKISDVIVSGGDPFTLTTPKLETIISQIRAVSSVGMIRIGTKTPVVLPQRIDNSLIKMLKKYQPIWVNTHFNHPREITEESKKACALLVDGGIPMGNQSVLLRGVNDDKLIYEQLCRQLLLMRVKPYYIFQCDLVNGVEHFRTKIAKGIEVMEHLRGRVSGLAIPQYVVDSPGGKIPILPTYMISQTPEKVVLRNYEGKIVEYPEISL